MSIKTLNAWNKLPVTRIKWNRQDPNILASAHDEGKVSVWDIRKSVTPLCNITAHVSSKITGIDWSYRNKDELLTCACDTTIKLWRPLVSNHPNQCHHTIRTGVAISRAIYTPQFQIIGFPLSTISATNTTDLRLWNLDNLQQAPVYFAGHKDTVSASDWRRTTDGTQSLITLGKDKQLICWGNFSPEYLNGMPPREVDLLPTPERHPKLTLIIDDEPGQDDSNSSELSTGTRSPDTSAPNTPSVPKKVLSRQNSIASHLESPADSGWIPMKRTEAMSMSSGERLTVPTIRRGSWNSPPEEFTPPSIGRSNTPVRPALREMNVSVDSLMFMNEMTGLIDEIQTDSKVEDKLILFPKDHHHHEPKNIPTPRTFAATFGASGQLFLFNSSIKAPGARTFQDFLSQKKRLDQQNAKYSRHSRHHTKLQTTRKAKVSIYCPPLCETSKRLALLYTLNGTAYQICRHNENAAASVQREDLVFTWRLLQNITHPDVYKPYSKSKDFDQFDALWSAHPFGQKLVFRLIQHYQKLGDIQTLAHIVTALTPPPNQNNDDDFHSPDEPGSPKARDILRVMNGIASPDTPGRRSRAEKTVSPGRKPETRVEERNPNDWATKLEQIEEKRAIHKLKAATSLLGVQLKNQKNQFCVAYAELLYSWGFLERRCEILKYVSGGELDDTEKFQDDRNDVKLISHCQKCSKALSAEPYCSSCKSFASLCSFCHAPVTGLSLICLSCDHGGHPKHIQEWFKSETLCPTGCGCKCKF